jgi:hypothetical protein
VLNIGEIEAMRLNFRAIQGWDNGHLYPIYVVGDHRGKELMAKVEFDALEIALHRGAEAFEALKNEAFDMESQILKHFEHFENTEAFKLPKRNVTMERGDIGNILTLPDFTELKQIGSKKPKEGRFTQRFLNKINKKR